MSRTAFSQHYNCELDAKQLLTRLGAINSVEVTSFELSDAFRSWMRGDLLCPSCRCAGATLVRSEEAITGRNTRQAHFRFLDARGQTAHKLGCDFYPLGDEPGFVRGVDIDFSVNDADTRLVRRLVCQALNAGLLDKVDIFAMRQWFLEARDRHSFEVTASASRVAWTCEILRLRGKLPLAFRPAHRGMAGFNARRAARRHLAHHYGSFLKDAPRLFLNAAVRDRTIRLAQRHGGSVLIDVSRLERPYDQTRRLAYLMVDLGALKVTKASRVQSGDRVSEALLALSATFLFKFSWDLDAALEHFGRIQAAPDPIDLTLGNVMGLNPFHDFQALRFLRWLSEQPAGGREFDFETEWREVLTWISGS